MIYVFLSRFFVVALFVLFPPIFLAWWVDSAIFFTFRMYAAQPLWMNLCWCLWCPWHTWYLLAMWTNIWWSFPWHIWPPSERAHWFGNCSNDDAFFCNLVFFGGNSICSITLICRHAGAANKLSELGIPLQNLYLFQNTTSMSQLVSGRNFSSSNF